MSQFLISTVIEIVALEVLDKRTIFQPIEGSNEIYTRSLHDFKQDDFTRSDISFILNIW